MRRTRIAFWVTVGLGFALGSAEVSAQTPEQVSAAKALLQDVAASDLAARASALVAGAPAEEQTNVLTAVMAVVAQRMPSLVPHTAAAAAVRAPTLAPVAAATACRLRPQSVVAIARAIARVPRIDREAVRTAMVGVVPDKAAAIAAELAGPGLAQEPPGTGGR